jgi:hypothetical protein
MCRQGVAPATTKWVLGLYNVSMGSGYQYYKMVTGTTGGIH